jgi:uncharacterized protein YlxW (UPF0749 family)
MKLAAGALLAAAIWAALAWWRASVVQEGWDARDATAKVELAQKQAEYDLLAGKVIEQNRAVEALAAASAAADERRLAAERLAAGMVKALDRRAADVAASTATTCDGVMRDAWEKW